MRLEHIPYGLAGQADDPEEALLTDETQPDKAAEIAALRERIALLEELVWRDTLTPLFNRRHFDMVARRWIARTARYGGHRALLFLDIDHMKMINDNFGHVVGDRLLHALADALRANIRQSDIAARIGGDEFAILLDNIDPALLEAKAAAIARIARAVTVDGISGPVRASCAVGHSMIRADDTVESLLDRADRNMYCQKVH